MGGVHFRLLTAVQVLCKPLSKVRGCAFAVRFKSCRASMDGHGRIQERVVTYDRNETRTWPLLVARQPVRCFWILRLCLLERGVSSDRRRRHLCTPVSWPTFGTHVGISCCLVDLHRACLAPPACTAQLPPVNARRAAPVRSSTSFLSLSDSAL